MFFRFLVASALLCVAIEAHADDDAPFLEDEPARATPEPTWAIPKSIDEYDERIHESTKALGTARREKRWVEADRLEEEVDMLDTWYAKNTHLHSPAMFVSGVMMVALGGGAVVVGFPTLLLVNADQCSSRCGPFVGGLAMIIGGSVLAGLGVPLMIVGSAREMGPKLSWSPTGLSGTF